MLGVPFFIDERAIVPRSYLGEIFDGELFAGEEFSLVRDARRGGTGARSLHRLGVSRDSRGDAVPEGEVDAVELSKDALQVAKKQCRAAPDEEPRPAAAGRSVRAGRRPALRPDRVQSALCRRQRHDAACRRSAGTSRRWRSTAERTGSRLSGGSSTRPGAHLNEGGGLLVRDRPRRARAGARLSAACDFSGSTPKTSSGEVFWLDRCAASLTGAPGRKAIARGSGLRMTRRDELTPPRPCPSAALRRCSRPSTAW